MRQFSGGEVCVVQARNGSQFHHVQAHDFTVPRAALQNELASRQEMPPGDGVPVAGISEESRPSTSKLM